jgi:hypothetical protein
MKTQNITIEKNMTAYNLLIGQFVDQHYGEEKCFFVWSRNGTTGEMISWKKGKDLFVNSLCYKSANINRADMTGILVKLKDLYPGYIGNITVPDEFKSYV